MHHFLAPRCHVAVIALHGRRQMLTCICCRSLHLERRDPTITILFTSSRRTMTGETYKRQSRRRMRPRGATRRTRLATVLMVASGIGVAGFSSFRPLVSKVESPGGGAKVRNAVAPTLSTERLDTKQQQGISPGSPLDMICKDQHEFELSVGHAMDVLRTDYDTILTTNPGTWRGA